MTKPTPSVSIDDEYDAVDYVLVNFAADAYKVPNGIRITKTDAYKKTKTALEAQRTGHSTFEFEGTRLDVDITKLDIGSN